MMAADKEQRAFNRMWDKIEDGLGHNDTSMRRDRPYNGQPHTDTGERGRTEIQGVTFRDLRDCFIRAVCLSGGVDEQPNKALYHEANKGENAALCENDVYTIKGDLGLMAVCQHMCCEVERIMGIYPNVPELRTTEGQDDG